MSQSDHVLAFIEEYLELDLFPPEKYWPKKEFLERSYSRWAVKEVIFRIKMWPNLTPLFIMDNFARELDCMSKANDNRKQNYIFSTARDAVIDLGLLFV